MFRPMFEYGPGVDRLPCRLSSLLSSNTRKEFGWVTYHLLMSMESRLLASLGQKGNEPPLFKSPSASLFEEYSRTHDTALARVNRQGGKQRCAKASHAAKADASRAKQMPQTFTFLAIRRTAACGEQSCRSILMSERSGKLLMDRIIPMIAR